MNPDLSVNLCGLALKNPVMTASGTFGYGLEFSPFFKIGLLGAVVVKGISLEARKGNPPIVVNGRKESRTGKIFATEFTGGTNGPEDLIKLQAEAGVGTILSMHVTDKALEVAKEHHVNIIQCSHMASDAIGMNLIIDTWQKKGAKLTMLPVSGFVRVDRTKNKKGRLVECI